MFNNQDETPPTTLNTNAYSRRYSPKHYRTRRHLWGHSMLTLTFSNVGISKESYIEVDVWGTKHIRMNEWMCYDESYRCMYCIQGYTTIMFFRCNLGANRNIPFHTASGWYAPIKERTIEHYKNAMWYPNHAHMPRFVAWTSVRSLTWFMLFWPDEGVSGSPPVACVPGYKQTRKNVSRGISR